MRDICSIGEGCSNVKKFFIWGKFVWKLIRVVWGIFLILFGWNYDGLVFGYWISVGLFYENVINSFFYGGLLKVLGNMWFCLVVGFLCCFVCWIVDVLVVIIIFNIIF